jgi:hypothetical protein
MNAIPEDALAFLRSIYQNPKMELHWRIKCAVEALQYERPRLAVTALVDGEDFASRLQRALDRMGRTAE